MTTNVEYVTTLISKMIADATSKNASAANATSTNLSSSSSSSSSPNVNSIASKTTADTSSLKDTQSNKSNKANIEAENTSTAMNISMVQSTSKTTSKIGLDTKTVLDNQKVLGNQTETNFKIRQELIANIKNGVLHIDFKQLSNEEGLELANLIGDNAKDHQIKHLLVTFCSDLKPASSKLMMDALYDNRTLRTFNVSGNHLGGEGAIALANVLRVNTSLTALSIRRNQLGPKDFITMADALQNNNTLNSLDLGDNNPGLDGVRALIAVMLRNNTIQTLGLGACQLDSVGIGEIARFIKDNKSICKLSLAFNQLKKEDEASIAIALQHNETLTDLDLTGTRLGGEGIASAIRHPKTALLKLNLSINRIGLKGGKSIAQALQFNNTLMSFNYSRNDLSDFEVAAILIEAIKINKTLTSLKLSYTALLSSSLPEDKKKISEVSRTERGKKFSEALQCNKSLTDLALDEEGIIDDDGKMIAEGLRRNTTLINLALILPELCAKGAWEIVSALTHHPTLDRLFIWSKSWDMRGMELANILEKNKMLSSLTLYTDAALSISSSEYYKMVSAAISHNITLTSLGFPSLCEVQKEHSSIMARCQKNLAMRTKLQNNWSPVCVALTFMRANNGHSFRHSVSSFFPIIRELADFGSSTIAVIVKVKEGAGDNNKKTAVITRSSDNHQKTTPTRKDFITSRFFMYELSKVASNPNHTPKLSDITSQQKSDTADNKGEKPGNKVVTAKK